MLTAEKARRISQKASTSKKDKNKAWVESYVKGILISIETDANKGYCKYDLDLSNYPFDIRMPIVHVLEDLGYKVSFDFWKDNICYIQW